MYLKQACFFNIFEKTQAQKNSRFEKTQGNFSPKLSETVVMVVTYILEIIFLCCSKLTNILKIALKTLHALATRPIWMGGWRGYSKLVLKWFSRVVWLV